MNGQDLRGLDLHGLRGGLTPEEWMTVVSAQVRIAEASKTFKDDLPSPPIELFEAAAVKLQGALLDGANLSGAILNSARLDQARCYGTTFTGAELIYAKLPGARLSGADLKDTVLSHADLYAARLVGAHIEGAQLDWAFLAGTLLNGAFMSASTNLQNAVFGDSEQGFPYLADIRWDGFRLEQITWSNLDETGDEWSAKIAAKAVRSRVKKLRASKKRAKKDTDTKVNRLVSERRHLRHVPHELSSTNRDSQTSVNNGANTRQVAELDKQVRSLKDNLRSRRHELDTEILGVRQEVMYRYERAARTARQISARLGEEAMTDVSKRFGYEAERLRRKALRYQLRSPGVFIDEPSNNKVVHWIRQLAIRCRVRFGLLGAFALSSILWALSGYGYKPVRAIIAYFTVILTFAAGYLWLGDLPFWPAALTYSVTSFHGRGFEQFFPGISTTLHQQQALVTLAAGEAIVGLLVEIVFIATFTKRFFER